MPQKVLSEQEFRAVADRVIASAPDGLTEAQFDLLIDREIEKAQGGTVHLARQKGESWSENAARGVGDAIINPGRTVGNLAAGAWDTAKNLYDVGGTALRMQGNKMFGGDAAGTIGPFGDVLNNSALGQGVQAAAKNPTGTWRRVKDDYYDAYVENPGRTLAENPIRPIVEIGTFATPALKAAGGAARLGGFARTGAALNAAGSAVDLTSQAANVAKAGARVVAPAAERVAQGFTRRSLKITPTDLIQKPQMQRAIDTQLEMGTYPTHRGFQRAETESLAATAEKNRLLDSGYGSLPASTATPELDRLVAPPRLGAVPPAGEVNLARSTGTDPQSLQQALTVRENWQAPLQQPLYGTRLQPVMSPTRGLVGQQPVQVQVGTQTAPFMPLRDLVHEQQQLGRRLSPKMQQGRSVPFEEGTQRAGEALYEDLGRAQVDAFPPLEPLNATIANRMAYQNQLLRGPLRQMDPVTGTTTYPSWRAQGAGLVQRLAGRGTSFVGHRARGLAELTEQFGTSPTFLPQVINPYATVTGALDRERIARLAAQD